jgi:hypothetical protein
MCLLIFTGEGGCSISSNLIDVQQTDRILWFPTDFSYQQENLPMKKELDHHHLNTLLYSAVKSGEGSKLKDIIEKNPLTCTVRKISGNKQQIDQFNPFQKSSPATFDHYLEPIKVGSKFVDLPEIYKSNGIKCHIVSAADLSSCPVLQCVFDERQLTKLIEEANGAESHFLNDDFFMHISLVNTDLKPRLYLAKFLKDLEDFKIGVVYRTDHSIVDTYITTKDDIKNKLKITGNLRLLELTPPKSNTQIFWGAPRKLNLPI